jgi:hypothetical protein
LALHTDGVDALLQVTGLVDHQHSIRVAEVIGDVAAQVVTDAVGVPRRPRQEVLQRIR